MLDLTRLRNREVDDGDSHAVCHLSLRFAPR